MNRTSSIGNTYGIMHKGLLIMFGQNSFMDQYGNEIIYVSSSYCYCKAQSHSPCLILLSSCGNLPKCKAHIPLETAFPLGTQHKQKRDKQYEINIPNANRPNANYILPARIGVVVASVEVHILGP